MKMFLLVIGLVMVSWGSADATLIPGHDFGRYGDGNGDIMLSAEATLKMWESESYQVPDPTKYWLYPEPDFQVYIPMFASVQGEFKEPTPPVVPEPATMFTFGCGLLLCAGWKTMRASLRA